LRWPFTENIVYSSLFRWQLFFIFIQFNSIDRGRTNTSRLFERIYWAVSKFYLLVACQEQGILLLEPPLAPPLVRDKNRPCNARAIHLQITNIRIMYILNSTLLLIFTFYNYQLNLTHKCKKSTIVTKNNRLKQVHNSNRLVTCSGSICDFFVVNLWTK
jgi:hypothetical protein